MVRIYEKRIDWLSVASRRIWGNVCERRYRTSIVLFFVYWWWFLFASLCFVCKSAPGNTGQKIVRCRGNSCRYNQCKQSTFENRYWYSAFLIIQWIYWIQWSSDNTKLQFPRGRMSILNSSYLASKPHVSDVFWIFKYREGRGPV